MTAETESIKKFFGYLSFDETVKAMKDGEYLNRNNCYYSRRNGGE